MPAGCGGRLASVMMPGSTRTRPRREQWEYSTGRRPSSPGPHGGIGRATAELLAEQGASVLINDLDADVAEEAANQIEGQTVTFVGDLTADGVTEQLVERAVEAFGQLDIVVNNAGYTWTARSA